MTKASGSSDSLLLSVSESHIPLADPTYSYGPRPWSEVENKYETTRESLLQIIVNASLPATAAIAGNANISGMVTIQ